MNNKTDNKNKFDLIVIGTGAAASTVAYKCNSAGWKVAVVDSRPFGGTCALRGCDPKKVLVGAAEVIDWNNRMKDKGIGNTSVKESNNDIHINWSDLMHFKRTFTEPVPKNREEAFSNAGIAAFHGNAQFVGPTAVNVYSNNNTNKNNKETIHGKHLLIATGAKPAKLNIPGEENITTSEQFLELVLHTHEEVHPSIFMLSIFFI
jgi:glutathione reductase (NADPH)